jgi:hypothetical protein
MEHSLFFPAGTAGVPMSLLFKQSLFMSTEALLLGEIRGPLSAPSPGVHMSALLHSRLFLSWSSAHAVARWSAPFKWGRWLQHSCTDV